jgi:chromosome segregation ATPase
VIEFPSKKTVDDPIVRTGSALFDSNLVSSDEQHHDPLRVVSRSTAEECEILRKRVSELKAELTRSRHSPSLDNELQTLHQQMEAMRREMEHSKRDLEAKQSVLSDYQAENHRLLTRISEMSSSHTSRSVSQGMSAVKETFSQEVEAIMACANCASLQTEFAHYRDSVGEAARVGEELTRVLEERDKLKNELKRVKASQSQERIQTILNENDKLKDALKKRFPSNLTSLVVSNPDTELQAEKDRVRELEAKLDRIDDQWKRRLENLRVNHDAIKSEYEKTIQSLMDQKRPRLPPPAPQIDTSEITRENEVLRKRISDLESRVESLKQFHSLKNRKPHSTNTLMIQRFRELSFAGPVSLGDMGSACPPLPSEDREVLLSEWANLLRSVLGSRDRTEVAEDLIASDYRKSGLTDTRIFVRCLSHNLQPPDLKTLVDVYGFGDDQIDYKSFLSDLATRNNVFISDLENENAALRHHVDALVTELREKIESFENDPIAQSLRNANEEMARKDNELKMYKSELNRFLSRNIRKVGLGE